MHKLTVRSPAWLARKIAALYGFWATDAGAASVNWLPPSLTNPEFDMLVAFSFEEVRSDASPFALVSLRVLMQLTSRCWHTSMPSHDCAVVFRDMWPRLLTCIGVFCWSLTRHALPQNLLDFVASLVAYGNAGESLRAELFHHFFFSDLRQFYYRRLLFRLLSSPRRLRVAPRVRDLTGTDNILGPCCAGCGTSG